jgi:hypothetical protein
VTEAQPPSLPPLFLSFLPLLYPCYTFLHAYVSLRKVKFLCVCACKAQRD